MKFLMKFLMKFKQSNNVAGTISIKQILEKINSDQEYIEKVKDIMIQNLHRSVYSPKKWYLKSYNHTFKCDKEGCGFVSPAIVDFNDYHLWLNVPCPKCGESIFTEEDYQSIILMNKILSNPIIRFIEFFGKLVGSKSKQYKMNLNGTGKINFEREQNKWKN